MAREIVLDTETTGLDPRQGHRLIEVACVELHDFLPTGRNFHEILRVLDSMQLTSKHKVATPANWKQGDDIILTAAVTPEEAEKNFPGYKTVKPYLRTAAQPQ